MGVSLPKSVFFHMPKTGGTWVQRSLESAFGDEAILLNADVGWHADITGIHIPPSKLETKKFSFTFVRHPLEWYMSYFRFKNAGEAWDEYKDDGNILSRDCASSDFYKFMEKLMQKHPDGYYHKLVKEFEDVDFVGRQESLYFDLCEALDKAGEDYDETDFLGQHVNVSPKEFYDQDYTIDQMEWVLDKERYVIDKYYEDY